MNVIILKEIKKKWWLIVLLAIISAAIITVSRTVLVKPVMIGQPVKISSLVSFDYNVTEENFGSAPVRLNTLFNTEGYIIKFITYTEQNHSIDWSKLNINWHSMDTINKLNWYKKHFFFNDSGNRAAELYITFEPNDFMDSEYIKDNAKSISAAYLSFANSELQRINPSYSIHEFDHAIISGNIGFVNESNLSIKYIIIGTVLGGLLGVFVISLIAIRKYRNE